jgi:hypothetical protein
MPVSGIAAAATPQQPLQPNSPTSGPHRHNGNNGPSISDVDGQSSSVAPPTNSTGRIGSVLDIKI